MRIIDFSKKGKSLPNQLEKELKTPSFSAY
jgi:hypothetical protein